MALPYPQVLRLRRRLVRELVRELGHPGIDDVARLYMLAAEAVAQVTDEQRPAIADAARVRVRELLYRLPLEE